MKKRILIMSAAAFLMLAVMLLVPVKGARAIDIPLNDSYIPDEAFREYLETNWGVDGVIPDEKIASIKTILLTQDRDVKDLSGIEYFTALDRLTCYGKDFTGKVDLSKNTALTEVVLSGCRFTSLNVNGLENLTKLEISSNSSLTQLDLGTNINLETLKCFNCALAKLDVSACKKLTYMDVSGNKLTSLDLSVNTKLTSLNCRANELTSLDITLLPFGTDAWYSASFTNANFKVGQNSPHMTVFLTSAQYSGLTGANPYSYQNYNTNVELLKCSRLGIHRTEIKDSALASALFKAANKDGNDYLSTYEMLSLTKLDLAGTNVTDFSYLYYFPNLTSLYLTGLTTPISDGKLDFARLPNLEYLMLTGNELTTIDLSGLPKLQKLYINWNNLESLDTSKNANLEVLSCENNGLTSLDVSKNTKLCELHCGYNSLTALLLPQTTTLTTVNCESNDLTGLVLREGITSLSTWGNKIRKLDVRDTKLFTEEKEYTGIGAQKEKILMFVTMSYSQKQNYEEYSKGKSNNGHMCYLTNRSAIDEDGWYTTDLGPVYIQFRLLRTGKFEQEGTYIADDYGIVCTGAFEFGDTSYYADDTGLLQKGWQSIDSTWYYYSKSSFAKLTGWQKISKKWYYLDPDQGGAMATGWKTVGTKRYYFGTSGAMVTGWKQISKKWYYFDSTGAMAKGWKQVGTKWYYFDKTSGAMQTGWLQIGSAWYYLDPTSGAMKTGLTTIGGKTYYFDKSSGAMKKNCDIDGWHFNKYGVGTKIA